MKPITSGEKDHVVKVGEEIDERKETPISIITTDTDNVSVPTISEQSERDINKPTWTGHYVLSVLTTICCFGPCSVIGLVQFLAAKAEYNRGNVRDGMKRKRQAKVWSWLSLTLGLILTIAFITYVALCARNYMSKVTEEKNELKEGIKQAILQRLDEKISEDEVEAQQQVAEINEESSEEIQEEEGETERKKHGGRKNGKKENKRRGKKRGRKNGRKQYRFPPSPTTDWFAPTSPAYPYRYGTASPPLLRYFLFNLPSFGDYPTTGLPRGWRRGRLTTPMFTNGWRTQETTTWLPTSSQGSTWEPLDESSTATTPSSTWEPFESSTTSATPEIEETTRMEIISTTPQPRSTFSTEQIIEETTAPEIEEIEDEIIIPEEENFEQDITTPEFTTEFPEQTTLPEFTTDSVSTTENSFTTDGDQVSADWLADTTISIQEVTESTTSTSTSTTSLPLPPTNSTSMNSTSSSTTSSSTTSSTPTPSTSTSSSTTTTRQETGAVDDPAFVETTNPQQTEEFGNVELAKVTSKAPEEKPGQPATSDIVIAVKPPTQAAEIN